MLDKSGKIDDLLQRMDRRTYQDYQQDHPLTRDNFDGEFFSMLKQFAGKLEQEADMPDNIRQNEAAKIAIERAISDSDWQLIEK